MKGMQMMMRTEREKGRNGNATEGSSLCIQVAEGETVL